MGMSIKTRTLKKIPVLSINGRIINVDAEKFKSKLEEFCGKKQAKVVVDFSQADFIDSFGLGTLVGFHTQMQKAGRELVILNTNPNPMGYIKRLFEMTSLDTIFHIVTEEDEV